MKPPTYRNICQFVFVIGFVGIVSLQNYAQTPTPTPCDGEIDPGNPPCVYVFKELPPGESTNHEPPIGISGETVSFETPCGRKFARNDDQDSEGYRQYDLAPDRCEHYHRPATAYKKRSDQNQYTEIQSVLVMSENSTSDMGEGRVTLREYHLLEGQKARLLLWVTKNKEVPDHTKIHDIEIITKDPPPANKVPKGHDEEEPPMALRSRIKLKRKESAKTYRTKKFQLRKARRIIKWQIVAKNANNVDTVLFEGVGDDLYHLYINFRHTPHEGDESQ